jgi:hypothetical protein
MWWMFATTLAVACTSGDARHEFKNQGRLCLYPASETTGAPAVPDGIVRTYAADQPVNVAVQVVDCLSPCSKRPTASCTIDASEGTLRVSSSGSFEAPDSNIGCTAACVFLIAHCATASLPAGAYTFEHGADTLALTVPSSGGLPCVGAAATAN